MGKLAELQAIFAGSSLALETYSSYADVVEGDASFEENVLLKARTLSKQLREAGIDGAVLADDSGLEVDALGGRPGVLSARYAGESATWPERRLQLLGELRSVPDDLRTARFVCVMALVREDGAEFVARGEVEGSISSEERGSGGFGYDPIFIPKGATQSFAEMAEEKKNSMSHRGRAARALLEKMRS